MNWTDPCPGGAAPHDAESGFLPTLMDMTILQLQASKSVDQLMTLLTNALSLMGDRVELRYQMLRYMAWLIPTIGFLGTVIGLSLALHLDWTRRTWISGVWWVVCLSHFTRR